MVDNRNENGELLTDFCLFSDLVVRGTVFPHETIHKTTWTSPDGHTENQIDHITINRQFRRSLLDVRVKRDADAATDHHLLVATMKIKLRSVHDSSDRPHHKFNVQFLGDRGKHEEFNCEVKNRFATLEGLLEETVANHWTGLQETWNNACTQVLGKKRKTAQGMADFRDLVKDREKERAEADQLILFVKMFTTSDWQAQTDT
ncbi:hypothetical protein C0Q70_08470 [Pomacea canaliculata]|uniref:Endonuclease/exonuclease/phosphatase domain-containing protein n=1 Tax=Pomacea canaliculata TaxID=400727 RepID=A0A2T7PHX9_POMCA|nr:hypothetical protein C0Q70_08470 [Pomacea canaliculata]